MNNLNLESSGNYTDSTDASDYTKRNSGPLQRKTRSILYSKTIQNFLINLVKI